MENYNLILGYIPLKMFLIMIFFAGIGVFIRLLINAQGRDQNSLNTPQKFSFLFLFKDNWKSILLSFILILTTLRFAASFFPNQFIGEELSSSIGTEKWLFGSLMIGYLYNSLSQILKNKSNLLKNNRENI